MIEGVVCRRMDVEEALRRSGRLKPLQFTFPASSHAVLASPTARMANMAIGGDMYIRNSSRAKQAGSIRRSSSAPLQLCPCYSAGTASRIRPSA
ncbi:MAG: hypothetical protein ACYSWW_25855, partial [Planctomycetota bacterium]